MAREKAVLHIWSGGLDSTALLFDLIKQGNSVEAVNFSYGSKHNAQERAAAWKIWSRFDPEGKIHLKYIDISLKSFRSSLLTDGGEIPEGHYAAENMKSTVVPFRNGIMLSYAVGLAESLDIGTVTIGAHSGDHTIYPDCRPEFLSHFSEAARYGTWAGVTISAPYQHMTKGDIVRRGMIECGAPLCDTWTCYKGLEKHCGKCGACVERREAFAFAGVKDSTEYLEN